MKTTFSATWNRSKQPRKQRKFRYNAPLHVKQKFLNVHLSKDLKRKHNKRSVGIRKGDNVKIMRGQFKNRSGRVERVDIKAEKVYIEGIETTKKDGTKVRYQVNPSNLMVTELNLDDKMRQKALERNNNVKAS